MNRCGIYEIVCVPTGQRYIGQSIDVTHRLKVHRGLLNSRNHGNPRLQDAWNKYGCEEFLFRVIEFTCSNREYKTERERHYVGQFKTLDPAHGFNIKKPTSPIEGRGYIAVTLSITFEQWEQLKAIERETGVRPSVTVRRLLERSLKSFDADTPNPAA